VAVERHDSLSCPVVVSWEVLAWLIGANTMRRAFRRAVENSMGHRSRLLVVAALLLILGVAVARPHPRLIPLREGTSKDFWAAATGVRSKGTMGGPSWCLPEPVNGWFVYCSQHMHGCDFYRVPQAEVLAAFPKGVEELRAESVFVPEWSAEGFAGWAKADPEGTDPKLLLTHLQSARLQWWISNHPESLGYVQQDFNLGMAVQRMGDFRLVQLMEWSYLSALIVFAAWPWIRNRRRWTWAIHAALVPPLLFLPYFLGYCSWTYTSAGPGGGVVYPFVLDACRALPWTSLDNALIRYVPQILDPLTGPLGPMFSISGGRRAGPVAVVCVGLVLGAAVFCLGSLSRGRRGAPTQAPPSSVSTPDGPGQVAATNSPEKTVHQEHAPSR
jgi:hypothetical protein